jgi:aminopeptidase-like protein
MTLAEVARTAEPKAVGEELHRFLAPLYPLCRSITGPGLRETLRKIAASLPIAIHEVASGTRVFDWEVPNEWTIREAWIKGPDGRTVVDFRDSNLHVLNYSAPVAARLPLAELKAHLHSLPDRPHAVPYRTSYYKETWGFCLSDAVLSSLPEGTYEVRVESTLAPGSLSYGELLLPGATADEVLVSCHVCHPSLANDNLSAIAVAVHAAKALAAVERRLSYRFLFVPGTIGSITWLAQNPAAVAAVRHGLVLAGLGDAGPLHYKRSEPGTAVIDRAVEHVLRASGEPHVVLDFVPFGYDERQYNSPGIALPVGSLTRTPHGRYPEYHTSDDDLDFVKPESLADAWAKLLAVFEVLEGDRTYRNLEPKCEPQLGRRGLYRTLGGGEDGRAKELALLWVLNQSDGRRSLLDIAERSRMPFRILRASADALLAAGLLEEVPA